MIAPIVLYIPDRRQLSLLEIGWISQILLAKPYVLVNLYFYSTACRLDVLNSGSG